MFTFKKWVQIRNEFIENNLCDDELVVIANREPKNTFWQKVMELPKHGIMAVKNDLIIWYPIKKDRPQFENKIEIKADDIAELVRGRNDIAMFHFSFKYKDGKCDKWTISRDLHFERIMQCIFKIARYPFIDDTK